MFPTTHESPILGVMERTLLTILVVSGLLPACGSGRWREPLGVVSMCARQDSTAPTTWLYPNPQIPFDPLGSERSGCLGLAERWEQRLEVNCQAVDAAGVLLADWPCLAEPPPEHLAGRARAVRVVAACQPRAEIPVRDFRGAVTIPLPEPERAYLGPEATELELALATAHGARGTRLRFPPNTEVEILRRLPDEAGGCAIRAVRVIDSGGARFPVVTPGATVGRIESAVFYVPASALNAQPHPGPSASHWVAEQEAAEHARRRADAEREAAVVTAVADREVQSGRCDPERQARLEQLREHLAMVMRTQDRMTLRWHEVVVATPDGVEVEFRPLASGAYHVFAAGFLPMTMVVREPDGSEIASPSPYATVLDVTGAEGATRLVRANPGERFRVRASGRGCTLLAAFWQP